MKTLLLLAALLGGCTIIHIEGHDNSITDAGGGLDLGLTKTTTLPASDQQPPLIQHFH